MVPKYGSTTEAQRYHCKYNFATASFILLPRDLFYCREFYFTAASFVLLPRDLFYCREFYFSTASFILLPRVLSYRREIYFAAASFIFTTASFIFITCNKIKLAGVKIKLWASVQSHIFSDPYFDSCQIWKKAEQTDAWILCHIPHVSNFTAI